jgi:putative DNA primase/helicase
MTLSAELVERARDVPIEDVIAKRGLNLRRQGRELVGACARCSGVDRFSIHLGKQVFNCRGCGGKGHGAIDLVMFTDGVDFLDAIHLLTGERPSNTQAAPEPDRKRRQDEERAKREKAAREREQQQRQDEARRRDLARALWTRRQPVTEDTPAAIYLRNRGYTGPIPPTLGYLPANGEHAPAMIAAFGNRDELEPGVLAAPSTINQVHITRLTAAGDKADVDPVKIILGSGTGTPVVLAPPNDLLGLAITEGIEDGLSVHASTGLGVWAAGTANRMPPLAAAVPSYIECVTIYAHADDAGRRHARELARALAHRLEVFIEGLGG